MIIDKIDEYLNEGVPSDLITKIYIEVRDLDNSLEKFLEELKTRANVGHSFSVLMDEESDQSIKIFFDGDGSFFVKNIEVEKPEGR